MARVPHVYVPPPWDGAVLDPGATADHHLRRVLRLSDGREVSYSDGRGVTGTGTLVRGGIERGVEAASGEPSRALVVAVAPPRDQRRARMIVEKLAELGCSALVWLDTERGEGRPPRTDRTAAWAIAALEQSRRDRLLEVVGPRPPSAVWDGPHTLFAATPGAGEAIRFAAGWAGTAVVLIGPEGGFAEGEVPESAVPVSLGDGVLRVETAALAVAVLFPAIA